MTDPTADLSDGERTYLAVLELASNIASASLALPVAFVTEAIEAGEKALAEDDGTAPGAIEDVKRQLQFLRAFRVFRSELDNFAAEPPPPEPGVSPGGVVLP